MNIVITDSYKEMSARAADIFFAQVTMKPDAVLGLATGSSPLGTYEALAAMYREGRIDFSEVTSINLDEYKGLGPDNEQSYRHFMQENLFSRININQENVYVPDGSDPDEEEACRRYDGIIEKAGGIDMQLLGIGLDGHIGFNEPADHFPVGTHCVDLDPSTIEANKRFFNSADEVPKKAYTVGIGTIMKAGKVVLIASGRGKAQIVKDAFLGPVTPYVPASVLQLHPDCTVILDKDAAAFL